MKKYFGHSCLCDFRTASVSPLFHPTGLALRRAAVLSHSACIRVDRSVYKRFPISREPLFALHGDGQNGNDRRVRIAGMNDPVPPFLGAPIRQP